MTLTASIEVGSLPLSEEAVLEILLTTMRYTSNRLLLISLFFAALGVILLVIGMIVRKFTARKMIAGTT